MDGSLLAVLPVIVFIFLFFYFSSKLVFFTLLVIFISHLVLTWLFGPEVVRIIGFCFSVVVGILMICHLVSVFFSVEDQGDDYGWKDPGPPDD